MNKFPILSGQYWYAAAYFPLSWMSPGLNHMARSLSRWQYLLAIAALYVVEFDSCREGAQGRMELVLPLRLGYTSFHLAIVYFIAGYLRLHSRVLPRIAIWIIFAFVFKLQFGFFQDTTWVRQWMVRHGMGLWECNFHSWPPRYTNIMSIMLAMLTICSGAGIALPEAIGKALAFLGSISFAVYLIYDHPLFRRTSTDRTLSSIWRS